MADETTTTETTTAEPRLELTQADINKLIEDRIKRERGKHAKELGALREALGVEDEAASLTDAIAVLREQAARAAEADAKKTKGGDDVAVIERRWQDRVAKLEADSAAKAAEMRAKMHGVLLDSEIRALVTGATSRITEDAPLILDRLLRDHLVVDDETFRVRTVGEGGGPRLNDKMAEMAPRDVLDDLLKRHPSLVRAQTMGGGGAQPGARIVPDGIRTAQDAYRANPSTAALNELTHRVLQGGRT